ncbi:MAG TPA: glycosyltransferase [Solirubrobacteraceae bacterium]
MPPLVSVVVPVFNGERFLAETLESALAQDHEPVEVIVVDDGSTDGSAEVAARYPVTVLRQENAGVAAARNAGAAAAKGELLAFLDQDDLWHPEKLSRQVAALAARPELGYAMCRMEVRLEPGMEKPAWLPADWLAPGGIPASIPSAWMVRRETFDRVGPFDPRYAIACDSDWLARAKDDGVPFEYVGATLLRWRIHPGNNVHDTRRAMSELAHVLHASVQRRPLVSVVIPVRNNARFLGTAIESAFAQTYEPYEVLVLDNASTDGSGEVAQRYDVRYVRNERDLGQAANRNRGIELAGGELVAFLDSDDQWLPEKLTLQVARLRARPELDFVISHTLAVLEPGVERPPWLDPSWLTEGLPGVLPGTILARREAFERIGAFDPAFEVTADTDWFARAVDGGLRYEVMPQVLHRWRIHGANTSYRRRELKTDLMRTLHASVRRKRAMAAGDA